MFFPPFYKTPCVFNEKSLIFRKKGILVSDTDPGIVDSRTAILSNVKLR